MDGSYIAGRTVWGGTSTAWLTKCEALSRNEISVLSPFSAEAMGV